MKLMFAGENATYVSVSAPAGDGIVWVSAYGGYEVHKIRLGIDPGLVINHGCFLGMISSSQGINYWNDYVKVGSTNGLFQSMMTDTGLVMKIKDSVPSKRPNAVCYVLTQRLNRSHFDEYVQHISLAVAKTAMSGSNHSESAGDGLKRAAANQAFKALGFGGKKRTHRKKRV